VDWELYERTHSALALGFVGLSQMIPMVACTLPAGHVADNFSRKRIILMMSLVLALASFGLTFISAVNAPVPWIYLCLVVIGAPDVSVARPVRVLPHLVRALCSRAPSPSAAERSNCLRSPDRRCAAP